MNNIKALFRRELRSYFGSATADMELSGNIAGIRDPVVDALILNAERATSIESSITHYKRALELDPDYAHRSTKSESVP